MYPPRLGLVFENAIESHVLDVPSLHALLNVPLEILTGQAEVLCRLLIERIAGVRLEEQELSRG